MKKILCKLLGGALLFGLTMSLTSCEDVLGHWEKPSPNPITPGTVTPTVEEVIKYGFKVTDLAGVDRTEAVTSLKMSKADGTLVAEAEVSGGKITITNTKLTEAGITAAADFWFEAEIGGKPYIAKVNINPTTLSPESDKTLEMATLGDVILADGTFAAPTSTGVAMIAYLGNGSECDHGLAIQLNASPADMDWSAACSYSSYPSITGNPGTWRLPSKADWQNMFVGCAKSGDAGAGDTMDPIAGFKEKIGATGITWLSFFYWSSLGSGSFACYVLVSLNGSNAKAVFNNVHVSNTERVLGCLAF